MFILSQFLELGTETCRASASSMLREGDWSHVQDTTEINKLIMGIYNILIEDNNVMEKISLRI